MRLPEYRRLLLAEFGFLTTAGCSFYASFAVFFGHRNGTVVEQTKWLLIPLGLGVLTATLGIRARLLRRKIERQNGSVEIIS